jgi:nucleotide-binding universal stress UspA family protein
MTSEPASDVRAELRTLVVPYDGSRVAARVLPVARALAERTGSRVTLLTSTFGGEGATAKQMDAAEAALEGIPVERVEVDDRSAADATIDVALSTDGALVCMSTHGRSGVGRAVLGSVADGVIRSGQVPVLVVGPECDPSALDHPGPVTMCVDGSARSPQVVAEGVGWARLLDREARMVLVSSPFDGQTRQESAEMFQRLVEAAPSNGVHLSGHDAINGSVAWGLVTEGDAVKAPLLVIAPASRSRWERLLVGSTTLAVLRSAGCPVLVLDSGASDPRGSR